MLDNEQVNVGDSVWDVLLHTGTVTAVAPDGGIEVRFGKNSMRYTAKGEFGGRRRLYWSDPVLIIPPKNKPVFVEQLRTMIALVTRIAGQ